MRSNSEEFIISSHPLRAQIIHHLVACSFRMLNKVFSKVELDIETYIFFKVSQNLYPVHCYDCFELQRSRSDKFISWPHPFGVIIVVCKGHLVEDHVSMIRVVQAGPLCLTSRRRIT